MPYIRDQAIVLTKKTVRRTDRWYSLLCYQHGYIEAFARSAASGKSKLAGHLEPGTKTEIMLAKGKDKFHIAGAQMQDYYWQVGADWQKTIIPWSVLNITNKLLKGESEGEQFFVKLDWLLNELRKVNDNNGQAKFLLDIYLFDIIGSLGWQLNLNGQQSGYLDLQDSNVYQQNDKDKQQLYLNKKIFAAVKVIISKKIDIKEKIDWLDKLAMKKQDFAQLHNIVDNYYRYHFI